MDARYISLDTLAARLGLPRTFLREQPRLGVIPHLYVGGRMRFEESAVREALRRQAARPPEADSGANDER